MTYETLQEIFTIQYGKFTTVKEYVHAELISSPLMSIISCGAGFTIQYGNFYVTKPHFLPSEAGFTIQYGKFTTVKEYVHMELIFTPLIGSIYCGVYFTIQYGRIITIQYGKFHIIKHIIYASKHIFFLPGALYLHTKITILYVPTYLYKSLTYIRPKHKTTTQHTNTLFSKGLGI